MAEDENVERIRFKDLCRLIEDVKDDEQKSIAHTPLAINDSGSEEKKNTSAVKPVINPLAEFEICPYCEETLKIYKVSDCITGEKIARCFWCHKLLVQSNIGWVKGEGD